MQLRKQKNHIRTNSMETHGEPFGKRRPRETLAEKRYCMFPEIPPRARRHFSNLSFTLGEELTFKLVEARSLLYRNEILQPNTHWKAFFKLYKIITPLHRSDVKIQQNFAEIFNNFCRLFAKNRFFSSKSHRFFADFNAKFPQFRSISRNFMKTAIDTRDLLNFWTFPEKFCIFCAEKCCFREFRTLGGISGNIQ